MALNSVVYIESPTEDFYTIIHQGINEYASKRGLEGTGGYFYVVYDESKVIAAISGFDNFGPAEIGGLWVDEKYRDQGYGKALVERAQEWAKLKGCKAMTVLPLRVG
ncbi:MAG: GNAT family N-acetyltransferase [Candidatus Berkiella sp.]